MDRLGDFVSGFGSQFENVNRLTLDSIASYIHGLLSKAQRKNIERIAEQKPGSNYQNIQYAVSDAQWDHRTLIDGVARYANDIFAGDKDTALIIDESGIAKKGEKSVGVARQWNGRLGKTDNCQVAVIGALSARASSCPIDIRLYLPESWANDPDRCVKAGIPENECTFKTKLDLAQEIIDHAVAQGVDFKWVGFDAFYGRSRKLLDKIDDQRLTFVGDVPKNTLITLPGRQKEETVEELAERRTFRRVKLRSQAKGVLEVEAMSATAEVEVRDGVTKRWRVVITKDLGTGDTKYSLTNSQASLQRLAYMQRQRYWVERAIQDAKTSCGMAQYQVRGWKPWHHHMALVMLAMLFLLEERVTHQETLPLLSCQDIVGILDQGLIQTQQTFTSEKEAVRMRHRQRFRDIKRRQDLAPQGVGPPGQAALTK